MSEPTIEEDSNILMSMAFDDSAEEVSVVNRVRRILEEVVVSKRLIKEATDGASEGCGIREAVALLISQRDNAYNEAEYYKQEMKHYKKVLDDLNI